MVHRRNGLLYAADPERGHSWIFTGRGLLRSAVRDGVKTKRGWNGEVHQFPMQSGTVDSIEKLSSEQSIPVVEEIHREAESLFNGFFRKRVPSYDEQTYRRIPGRFKDVYGTVPILPPDQYRSLLFNLTEGCSFNGCHFCHFYEGNTFQTRSFETFKGHVASVLEFFEPALNYFTGVFLGEGDALSASTGDFLRTLKYLRELPRVPSESICCFGMGNTGEQKTTSELASLRENGLDRVYLGLETGCEELVERLNKPFSLDEFHETVTRLKNARMNLGVIVLLGPGGSSYRDQHPRDTAKFLNNLPLDESDRLFLSPLGDCSTGLPGWATDVEPLTNDQQEQQADEIRQHLSHELSVAGYEIDRFLY